MQQPQMSSSIFRITDRCVGVLTSSVLTDHLEAPPPYLLHLTLVIFSIFPLERCAGMTSSLFRPQEESG